MNCFKRILFYDKLIFKLKRYFINIVKTFYTSFGNLIHEKGISANEINI